MTATHVDGLAVITSEPAEAPLSKPEKPVYYRQTLRLLLEDGTERYGCLHCDYTAATVHHIRPHLRTHKKPAAAGDMSLTDLLERIAALDEVTADRDSWKRRAQAAERQLKAIRTAITGR